MSRGNVSPSYSSSQLTHSIAEIRERALFNIISKLDNHLIDEHDTYQLEDILSKLLQWFTFPQYGNVEAVVTLIGKIIKNPSNSDVIRRLGVKTLEESIVAIQETIKCNCSSQHVESLLNDILSHLHQQHGYDCAEIPPLESDIPLSYRTGDSFVNNSNGPILSSPLKSFDRICNDNQERRAAGKFYNLPIISKQSPEYPFFNFPSHTLVSSDEHVITSAEDCLRACRDPRALLQFSHFFTDVLLEDFPPEIFLQKSDIILLLKGYLVSTNSSRIADAIIACFIKLTKKLITRVRFGIGGLTSAFNDNICECYVDHNEISASQRLYMSAIGHGDNVKRNSNYGDNNQQAEFQTSNQLSPIKYCLSILQCILQYSKSKLLDVTKQRTKDQQPKGNAINKCLALLNQIIVFLPMCMRGQMTVHLKSPLATDVMNTTNTVLTDYCEILDGLRLQMLSCGCEHTNRVVQLQFLCNFAFLLTQLIPLDTTSYNLAKQVVNTLANCLLDPIFTNQYRYAHEIFLRYTEAHGNHYAADLIIKYKEVRRVCQACSAVIKLFKGADTLPPSTLIQLTQTSLPCLEFHRNFNLIKCFLQASSQAARTSCDGKTLTTIQDVILVLLAHENSDIKKETYKLCYNVVVATAGPRLNLEQRGIPSFRICFLLFPDVITELLLFGVSSENEEIKEYASNIVILLLKCNILVPNDVWDRLVEVLILNFPLLACFANNNTALGRAIMQILDPDMASGFRIPSIEIIRGNVALLFAPDPFTREEAVSRLSWLLSIDSISEGLIPHIRSIDTAVLKIIGFSKSTSDVNQCFANRDFGECGGGNLREMMNLLSNDNIEAVVRRSALTQMSVILQHPKQQATFLENNGVELVLHIIKCALSEHDHNYYPDAIIPAIFLLRNISLLNTTVRYTLSFNLNIYHYILRGVCLYPSDESFVSDASSLLFLLVFNPFIVGTPLKHNLSIPLLLLEQLNVPFHCNFHWKHSRHTIPSSAEVIKADRSCLSCIQIHWNLEWFDGLNTLLQWNTVDYSDWNDFNQFDAIVHLRDVDLISLKVSSIEYCLSNCLVNVQNSTTYADVMYNLAKIESYINLYSVAGEEEAMELNDFLNLPWEKTFLPYLKMFPSNENDVSLVANVVQILTSLLPFYRQHDNCWMIAILKDSKQSLRNLLHTDTFCNVEFKRLHQQLLQMIASCSWKGKQYKIMNENAESTFDSSWHYVLRCVLEGLKFNQAQHVYNLANLNSLLNCLAHLTALVGWSRLVPESTANEPIAGFISILCELAGAFYCGKGTVATSSFMGVNITRQILIILNNILMEMKALRIKNWIRCFIDEEVVEKNIIFSFCSLSKSRDVFLRAAAFEFLSGLSISSKCPIGGGGGEKNNEIAITLLNTIFDNEEACLVRENATNVLVNVLSRTTKADKGIPGELSKLLWKPSFFQQMVAILNNFNGDDCAICYSSDIFNSDYACKCDTACRTTAASESWNSATSNGKTEPQTNSVNITANFVRLLSALSMNLFSTTNNATLIIEHVLEYNLIQTFLRCITLPQIEILTYQDLYSYCDILQMNSTISSLLCNIIGINSTCYTNIVQSQNSFNTLFLLFRGDFYYDGIPHLVSLRNQLWTNVYRLVEEIIKTSLNNPLNRLNDQVHANLLMAIRSCGPPIFLQTLIYTLSTNQDYSLQCNGLNFLCCMLNLENAVANNVEESFKDLMDTVKVSSRIVNNVLTATSAEEQPNDRIICIDNFNNVPLKVTQTEKEGKENDVAGGAKIANLLLQQYQLGIAKATTNRNNEFSMKMPIVLKTLTALLLASNEAKRIAFEQGLMDMVVQELKEMILKLGLESPELLIRGNKRGRGANLLNEIQDLFGLCTNFIYGEEKSKRLAAACGLTDLIHKLWIWSQLQVPILITTLKLLCTFTTDCVLACQSLTLTTAVIGSGPRKTPTNSSLLHEIICLIVKEMNLASRSRDQIISKLSFHILHNCCVVHECRSIIAKSNLLHCLLRLHPSLTKHQKQWTDIELIWLEFLLTYTTTPDGQLSVVQTADVFEIIMMLVSSPKLATRKTALLVLRNIASNSSNRTKLLYSDEFLSILRNKLTCGCDEERTVIVTIVWFLCANNQRGKIILKCAGLDSILADSCNHLNIASELGMRQEDLDVLTYVRTLLEE